MVGVDYQIMDGWTEVLRSMGIRELPPQPVEPAAAHLNTILLPDDFVKNISELEKYRVFEFAWRRVATDGWARARAVRFADDRMYVFNAPAPVDGRGMLGQVFKLPSFASQAQVADVKKWPLKDATVKLASQMLEADQTPDAGFEGGEAPAGPGYRTAATLNPDSERLCWTPAMWYDLSETELTKMRTFREQVLVPGAASREPYGMETTFEVFDCLVRLMNETPELKDHYYATQMAKLMILRMKAVQKLSNGVSAAQVDAWTHRGLRLGDTADWLDAIDEDELKEAKRRGWQATQETAAAVRANGGRGRGGAGFRGRGSGPKN